jgi:sugar lactone lactonase YvrE
VQSNERDFVTGKTQGAAVTSDGKVVLAPTLEPKTVDTQLVVFSQATDGKGNLYLGTWIEGQVLRVNAEGKTETLVKTTDPAITAVATDAQGNVYAGSAPSGVIYKISADGKSETWCDLPETYIWAIEPDNKGNAYAATGPNGRVYKVTADGKFSVVLETPDRHVLALAADKAGNVYAGTHPRGKVYRISADGAASTFYETPARYAVQSLATDDKGNLYVGTTGAQARVFMVESSGEVKELLKGSRERHVYAMASDGANVYVGTGSRGKIYRLRADETVATLAQPDDLYITTLANHSGTLYVATASAGRVLQLPFDKANYGTYVSSVKDIGTIAKWGVVRWQAGGGPDARLSFQTRTGNTAYPDKTWSDWSAPVADPRGSAIQSPPGRYIQYRVNLFALKPDAVPALERVEIVYMTKNRPPQLTLKAPAGGEVWSGSKTINWSAQDPDKDKLTFQVFSSKDNGKTWEEIKGDAKKPSDAEKEGESRDESKKPEKPEVPEELKGMVKPVPPKDKEEGKGRMGEWENGRARKGKTERKSPSFTRPFALSFFSVLRSPLQPPPTSPGSPSSRPSGSGRPGMIPPELSEPDVPDLPDTSDLGGSANSRSWDTAKVPDGVYLIKVTVTDKTSNPKDALTDEKISRAVVVDNSSPQVTMPEPPKEKPTKPLIVKVSDAATYVASAEYRIDSGEWVAAVTADGVFDSASEDVEIAAADLIEGKHTLEIRVRDAAGNEAKAKLEYAWGKAQPAPKKQPTEQSKPPDDTEKKGKEGK